MKSSTRTHVVKACASVGMVLMGLFANAQQKGVIFYDDCEATNKPQMVGSNGDVSKGWSSKQGHSSVSSITRSNAYARKGSYSYKHTLTDSNNDSWEYLKAELAWNFLPAGSPLGTVGDRTAYYRAPLGLRWFAASTLIPSSNKDKNTVTSILFNTKAVEDDWPTPTYLAMENDRYVFFITKLSSNGTATVAKYDVGPVVRDQWEDWVMHRDFNNTASGFVRLYKNGKLVAEYIGPNWKIDGKHSVEPYMQMGLYKWAFRSNWTPKPDVSRVEMYMDEIRFGTAEAKLEDFLLDNNAPAPAPSPAPANQLPTVKLSANQTITLPTNSVTLTGTATDPDGSISTYKWSQVSGPNTATITNGNMASARFSNLVQGTYSFRLTVTDNKGGTASATASVTVNPAPLANVPPVASAGSDKTITLPTNSTTLNGSGKDSDGTIASYAWSQVAGPNTATFSNAKAASTTVSNLIQGRYTFRLTVTDDKGAKHTDDVNVTVNAAANHAPTVDAGSNRNITLPTSETTLAGTASDEDGTIASYSWSQVSGPSTATIASKNAASTKVSNLVQGLYTFRLTVTDDKGAKASDEVSVRVNAAAAENIAPVAEAGSNRTITLPTNRTTLTGSGTDSDGSIASYRWSQVSGPSTAGIATPTAASTAVTDLKQGSYVFRLTVTDNKGATDTDEVTVTVRPAPIENQPPVANAGANRTITLPTNSANLSGSGTDADGQVVSYRWTQAAGPSTATIGSPNTASTQVSNLREGEYTFRLTVTDDDGAKSDDHVTVTVRPAPAAQKKAPVANAGGRKTVNTRTAQLDGSASYDPDGNIVAYNWTQASGPNSATIRSARTAKTDVANLTTGTYVFNLQVTDNDGLKASSSVTLVVTPAPVAPVAQAGTNITISLPTNSVNLDGSASSDADGSITAYRWSQISGPAAATIASPAAAKTAVTNLNEGLYLFQLEVTDNAGLKGRDTIRVRVNPNQAPVIVMAEALQVNLPADTVTLDGSKSYDPDGRIRLFQWKMLNGPNTPVFQDNNKATTRVSGLTAGVYTFELLVRDNGNITVRKTVTVTVNGRNNSDNISMRVYPNPVSRNGQLTLRLDDNSSGRGTVHFYSTSGVLMKRDVIFKKTTHFSETYNISNFPAGAYIIRVQFEGMAPAVKKITKQ